MIIDKLSKSTHFIMILMAFSINKLVELYVHEIIIPWNTHLDSVKQGYSFHFKIMECERVGDIIDKA